MKKSFFLVLVVLIACMLSLSACGLSGGNNDVNIKTDDGEIVAGDNVKWPESGIGNLQKPNAEITGVIKDNTTGSYTIVFSDMSKSSADEYLAKLKEQGYSPAMEVTDTDGILFTGMNASGVGVSFTYTESAEEGTITYMPNQ